MSVKLVPPPPQPQAVRDATEDAWLIRLKSSLGEGLLQLYDDGHIVALITDGKRIRTLAIEDFDTPDRAEHDQWMDKALGKLAPKGTWLSEVLENVWRAGSLSEAVERATAASKEIERSDFWTGPREREALAEKIVSALVDQLDLCGEVEGEENRKAWLLRAKEAVLSQFEPPPKPFHEQLRDYKVSKGYEDSPKR